MALYGGPPVSPAKSAAMRRIATKGTEPELLLRRALHALGFRFRLHRRDLPGSPDIVLPRYQAAIFVHGCFWHQHKGCKRASIPKTRAEFWATKLQGNVARDTRVEQELTDAGWRVIVAWECEIKSGLALAKIATSLGK